MLIDIHRHTSIKGGADIVLQNVFHDQRISASSKNYLSVGLHPWHIVDNKFLKENIKNVERLADSERVIAIGEAGLDKAIETDIELQKNVFEEQILIAKTLHKPMIIHCVRAYNDILAFRKSSGHLEPWIIHWFNASHEMAMELIKRDCYLSFGNTLFKENQKGFRAFKNIPSNRIFLETDDVDIPIVEIYNKAAELKEISLSDLKKQIKTNFYNCFGISL